MRTSRFRPQNIGLGLYDVPDEGVALAVQSDAGDIHAEDGEGGSEAQDPIERALHGSSAQAGKGKGIGRSLIEEA